MEEIFFRNFSVFQSVQNRPNLNLLVLITTNIWWRMKLLG